MRKIWTICSAALLAIVASGILLDDAHAQAAPVIQDGPGCMPNMPAYCQKFLVNRDAGGRVVVNLSRRFASNTPPTFYDRHLAQVSDYDVTREVLLGAGAQAPLVSALVLSDAPTGVPNLVVQYEYRILGSHAPGPDDINDDANQNVDDYFRLFVHHRPRLDNTDACRIGAVAHPARFLSVVNFNSTKSIVIRHRNTAPRYGSNPEWRVTTVPPGSRGMAGVGCVSDIAAGFIQIAEVRFGT